MAEVPSVRFTMFGAGGAIAAGLDHIEQQVAGIEAAIADNPGLAFDLAKTLVESVCQRILKDRGKSFGQNDDLPRLFSLVSQSLPFLPANATADAQIRQSLTKAMSGLQTAIQGICELRNRCGFASHGAAEPRPAMESAQALLAAQAADTIVGFLHRMHRSDMQPKSPQLRYEDNPRFNDLVDEAHGMIRIFEVEFRPSEVLYEMERESYKNYLAEFLPVDGELAESEVLP